MLTTNSIKPSSIENPLPEIEALVRESLPDVEVGHDRGVSHLYWGDFAYQGKWVVVQYEPHHFNGFGLSLITEETGYGCTPDEICFTKKETANRIVELLRRANTDSQLNS